MFSGIITDIGTVKSAVKAGVDLRLEIETALDLTDLEMGASVACAGACMTVVEKTNNSFTVDVSAESLSKTTLGNWKAGTRVNLERALKMGDEMGGHQVSGHVDGLGTVVSAEPVGESLKLAIGVDADLAPLIAAKGSIVVDGVSLTVNGVGNGQKGPVFDVNIIPHTQTHTTLGALGPGDHVNVEIDMMARYVARLQEND